MLEWVLVPVWAKDTTNGYRLANALMRPIHERWRSSCHRRGTDCGSTPQGIPWGSSGRSWCPTMPGSWWRSR